MLRLGPNKSTDKRFRLRTVYKDRSIAGLLIETRIFVEVIPRIGDPITIKLPLGAAAIDMKQSRADALMELERRIEEGDTYTNEEACEN